MVIFKATGINPLLTCVIVFYRGTWEKIRLITHLIGVKANLQPHPGHMLSDNADLV